MSRTWNSVKVSILHHYIRPVQPTSQCNTSPFSPRNFQYNSCIQGVVIHGQRNFSYSTGRLGTISHYTLFSKTLKAGPPPAGPFAIDLTELRKEFIQLQSLYHPDRHLGATDKKKAEGTSALINEAYKTLQDPLKRAQYLLLERGIDVAEDERLKTEDLDLLETVMDVRATVEGAQHETELDAPRQENENRIANSVSRLEEAFKSDNLHVARDEAIRLRYWSNIQQSIESWEQGKPIVLVH